MNIAVLSGKGGTGKTLVSVNLSVVAGVCTYVDCDVEEPNGHLFLKPEIKTSEKVTIKIPKVHQQLCNGCRKCVDFCNFNALAYINNKLIIFDDVCHSCGGCTIVCPEKALIEKDKVIGQMVKGKSQDVSVLTGILKMGEASGVPIIKRLLKKIEKSDALTIIDCPPGSACTVMESIKDVDYCILIAEPTVFGVQNLSMVYELVKLFGKPHGVILNKCVEGNDPSEEFCIKNHIKILGRIPYDQRLAQLNASGQIVARVDKDFQALFTSLLRNVLGEVI